MPLPDPASQPGYYSGTAIRRLFAFLVDSVLICVMVAVVFAIAAVLAIPTLGLTLALFIPFYAGASLIYRLAAMMSWAATPGMRLVGLEVVDFTGTPVSPPHAFLHTLGFLVCLYFPPLLLVSAITIAMTARGQGLHDVIFGTAVINRPV